MSEDHPEAITSHIVFDSSHVGNTWAWSEIIPRSMMDGELGWWFTLGHTPIISDGFSEAPLSTLGHTPLIDDSFFRDDVLHWGIVGLLLSHWIMMDQELLDDPTLGHSHFRERFYWRYSHSTRCSALGHVPLIDSWFLRWRFTLRHDLLIGDGLWFFIRA